MRLNGKETRELRKAIEAYGTERRWGTDRNGHRLTDLLYWATLAVREGRRDDSVEYTGLLCTALAR